MVPLKHCCTASGTDRVELSLSSPAGTGKPAGAVLGSSAMSTETGTGKVWPAAVL